MNNRLSKKRTKSKSKNKKLRSLKVKKKSKRVGGRCWTERCKKKYNKLIKEQKLEPVKNLILRY